MSNAVHESKSAEKAQKITIIWLIVSQVIAWVIIIRGTIEPLAYPAPSAPIPSTPQTPLLLQSL